MDTEQGAEPGEPPACFLTNLALERPAQCFAPLDVPADDISAVREELALSAAFLDEDVPLGILDECAYDANLPCGTGLTTKVLEFSNGHRSRFGAAP